MDTIAVSTHLNVDDWRALQAQSLTRLRGANERAQWVRVLVLALLGGAAALATVVLLSWDALALDAKSLLAGLAFVYLAIWINASIVRRRAAPDPHGSFLATWLYELGSTGLRTVREGHSTSVISWAAVLDVTSTAEHVFLWLDRFTAMTIPGRDLPNGLTPQQLVEWIAAARARAAAATVATEPAPASSSVAAAATAETVAGRRGEWLRDLASLVALRGKAVLPEPNQGWAVALVTLLALGTWVLLSRWEHGTDAVFYPYGVSDLAWYLLGGLAIAWLFARASEPRVALPRALVVSALGAWLIVLYFYLGALVESRWVAIALVVVVMIYGLAYLAQAARALTGHAQPRATFAVAAAIIAFFWLSDRVWVYPMVWAPSDEQYEESVAEYDDFEPLFFAQRDRIDTALAAVPLGNPAATELYFVGFAGVGEQKVFAEEIKFAARAVEDRYSNDAGSVLLLNDVRDYASAPVATATTLEYALHGIAAKMQTDDDVLFLALSSHGSRDWALSVSNGALPLTDIGVDELAAALDESGIKWRVIVISACFAGGFIDALQDPHTIVVAAAAPDRASFGCSNERDLTYFGEAFYRDALPKTVSLRDAFAVAEQRVLFRESGEGIEPSHPMAFFGAELERKLAALQ